MNIELSTFLLISLVLAITPGPGVLYVVAYSLRYGTTAGLVSTLGVNAGSIASILIAAFGLSTLITAHPGLIRVIQLVGGLYVIYLATQLWPRATNPNTAFQEVEEFDRRNLFTKGVVNSLLNPKDILFYTAFIPTFISAGLDGPAYRFQFLTLAFIYAGTGLVTKSLFCVFSGQLKSAFESKNINLLSYSSALILFAVGGYILMGALGLTGAEPN